LFIVLVCSIIYKPISVNEGAYMDFREATDQLFNCVSHKDLADRLGVSVASIRQARLREEAEAHRNAPSDWRNAVIRLSEERVAHYRKLIEKVRANGKE
jgi:hypothetical protein